MHSESSAVIAAASKGNNGSIHIGDGGVLGHAYVAWRRLQHGQEQVIRWGDYRAEFPGKLREQTGHEHRCSIELLGTIVQIRLRPYLDLDRQLLTTCIACHDEPEGILVLDIAAYRKTDQNDLTEYLAFERLYRSLSPVVWTELQRAYLLQYCLKNPSCFPGDAREVMAWLKEHRYIEAMLFDVIQRLDYLFYAYEAYTERGMAVILERVTTDHMELLDLAAEKIPGFGETTWTPECRGFFGQFFKPKCMGS